MLYYLFSWLDQINFPGAGLFQFISFRASLALITSLIVSVVIGKRIIARLRYQQIGETVRDLGLTGQIEKEDPNKHIIEYEYKQDDFQDLKDLL